MTWPTIFANLAAGNQPLSLFDSMFAQVAQLVAIPCTASGANAIVLTPIGNAPTINAYTNFQMFRFKAAGSSSAAVSVQFTGLSALPVFQKDGVTQCAAGSLVGGQEYLVCFDQSRNANAGGFYLEDAAQPVAQGASPVWGPFTNIASAATTDLSTAPTILVNITGTATITSFGAGVNLGKVINFAGSLLLTNGTNLILPGGANIQTQANDFAIAVSNAFGQWFVLYGKKSGAPILTGTSGLPLVGQGAGVDSAHAVLTVPGGGTGDTSLTAHGVVVGEGAAALGVTAAGGAGIPLIGQGGSADPVFGTAVVAGGGTGATSLTAHGVLVGEGTSPIVATAVGSAGQVLTSNGAGNDPTFQTPATGAGVIATPVQILVSSQTVTIPTNATKLKVTLVGGGGGGGGAAGASVCGPSLGGPGTSAGALVKFLSGLTAGNTLVLTIGGGGGGGAAGQNSGSNGGDTTLASGTQTITTLTAGKGGAGGGGTTGTNGTIASAGSSLNGDLNISAMQSGFVAASVGVQQIGPNGFGFFSGFRDINFGTGHNGVAAVGFGGGGAGGYDVANGNTARAGGAGSQGAAIFEWFA